MSRGIVHFSARAVALLEAAIDTDVIFPARFLLRMEKDGLGECLFADRREMAKREGEGGFPFPLDRVGRPGILLAGAAFGCGSSREHAVWALVDYGIRAVIAPSFGEIFANNAARNGLAAIRLPGDTIADLVARSDSGDFRVDFTDCSITSAQGQVWTFALSEDDRSTLMNGWDEIDLIEHAYRSAIDLFEQSYWARRPWSMPPSGSEHGD